MGAAATPAGCGAITSCYTTTDRGAVLENNCSCRNSSEMDQAQILIALVVAAHAGVLAVRLCVSLYSA